MNPENNNNPLSGAGTPEPQTPTPDFGTPVAPTAPAPAALAPTPAPFTPETPATPAPAAPAPAFEPTPTPEPAAAPVPGSIGNFTSDSSIPTSAAAPAPTFPISTPKKSRTGTIVLIIIALVVLIGGGLLTWFLVNEANKTDQQAGTQNPPAEEIPAATDLVCTREYDADDLTGILGLTAASEEITARYTDFVLDDITSFTTFTFKDEVSATTGLGILQTTAKQALTGSTISPDFTQDAGIISTSFVATSKQLTASIASDIFEITTPTGGTLDTSLETVQKNYTDKGYTCSEK